MARPYKVICISVYLDDLAELDRVVADARAAGDRRASRSKTIRDAVKALKAPTPAPHR